MFYLPPVWSRTNDHHDILYCRNHMKYILHCISITSRPWMHLLVCDRPIIENDIFYFCGESHAFSLCIWNYIRHSNDLHGKIYLAVVFDIIQYNVVSNWVWTHNFSGDYTGSWKSNSHAITTTTVPVITSLFYLEIVLYSPYMMASFAPYRNGELSLILLANFNTLVWQSRHNYVIVPNQNLDSELSLNPPL
jgi:hypothetical protein